MTTNEVGLVVRFEIPGPVPAGLGGVIVLYDAQGPNPFAVFLATPS